MAKVVLKHRNLKFKSALLVSTSNTLSSALAVTVEAWTPRVNCQTTESLDAVVARSYAIHCHQAHDSSPANIGSTKQRHAMSPYSFCQTVKIIDNVS